MTKSRNPYAQGGASLAAHLTTVSLILLAILCTSRADDLPPGVVDTQDPNDVSLSPDESLARITVPEGFNVTLFAGEPDLRRPIAFDFDDRGRIWVVENYSHPYSERETGSDRILILEDTNHDGRFDKRTVFWDKGRYLSGIAVGHGGVWIANTPELSFIPDRDGDDVPDSEPVVVLDGFVRTQNNFLNNIHWGPDGWLYGAIGIQATSFVGPPGTAQEERVQMTRGIWRLHPLSRTFEVVAEGMINPWGADFNAYGDLFTANTVVAHLWHIVPGMKCQSRSGDRDHRYAYGLIQSITDHLHWGGGVWHQARNGNDDRHSVAGGGHAHCGAMIYLGDNWPAKYRGTFFTNLPLQLRKVGFDHKLIAGVRVVAGVEELDLVAAACGGLQMPEGGIALNDPRTEDVEIVVVAKFTCEDRRDFRGENDTAIWLAFDDGGSRAFLADRRTAEFFRGPRKLPIGGGLSRLGDNCLRHRFRAVSPRAPDEGQDRGDLMVVDRATEPEPGHVEVPLFVSHFDRPDQTVEDDLGQPFGWTVDPFAASERWRQSR
jgi:putative membrane-bound dehydrogenase-like protein